MGEQEHKGIYKIYQWNKDRKRGYKLVIETISLEIRRVWHVETVKFWAPTLESAFFLWLWQVYTKDSINIIASDYKH